MLGGIFITSLSSGGVEGSCCACSEAPSPRGDSAGGASLMTWLLGSLTVTLGVDEGSKSSGVEADVISANGVSEAGVELEGNEKGDGVFVPAAGDPISFISFFMTLLFCRCCCCSASFLM